MNSSTTIASARSVVPSFVMLPEAAEFCRKNEIQELVEIAVQIASSYFTMAGPIEAEVLMDPDADEELLLLIAPVSSTVEQTRRASWKNTSPTG